MQAMYHDHMFFLSINLVFIQLNRLEVDSSTLLQTNNATNEQQ